MLNEIFRRSAEDVARLSGALRKAERERDEARRELAACTEACRRLHAQVEPLIEQRDEVARELRLVRQDRDFWRDRRSSG